MGLDIVELILIVEEEFHIEISRDDPAIPAALETLGTLSSYIADRLDKHGITGSTTDMPESPKIKYEREIMNELQNALYVPFSLESDIRQLYPQRTDRVRFWKHTVPHPQRYCEENRRIYHICLIAGTPLFIVSIFFWILVLKWSLSAVVCGIIGSFIGLFFFAHWLSYRFEDIPSRYKTMGDLVSLLLWHRMQNNDDRSRKEPHLPIDRNELEYRLKEIISGEFGIPFDTIQSDSKLSDILSM